jgi:DNA-binding CsgD family transcriptional regulator
MAEDNPDRRADAPPAAFVGYICSLTKQADQGSVYTHIAHWARWPGGAAVYISLETLQRAVELVDSLAELDAPASFAGIVLPGLATLVGCDVLTYNEIGPAHGQVRYADYPAGTLDPASQPVFAAHVHEHPLVNHYRATGSGEPVMISDFLTRQRFHRLGLYAEFFRAIPVEHQMAVSLPGPEQQVIGVAINRGRCDFSDQDRALLSVLRAPLNAALHRARRRQQAGHALTTMVGSGLAALTERETQILRLVADGRTNTAIAHALEVSPRTVAKHLEHAYRKLGVNSRAAAVSRITMPEAR